MEDGRWNGRAISEISDLEMQMFCAVLDPPDDRGLMPLDQARRALAGLQVYQHRTERREPSGFVVRDTDVWWAALLSLQDAEEFVAIATTLQWRDHVRAMDNVSAFQRFGDGILPWLRSRVDGGGVLHNTPWCVLPCLLESSSREAFDIAASVKQVVTWSRDGYPEDMDTADPAETIRRWLSRHPEAGYSYIVAGGEGATVALRSMFNADPRGTQRRLRAAVGKNEAERLLAAQSLQVPPMPRAVQSALRAAPERKGWPGSIPLAMADLDLLFEDYQGPAWDNANQFTSAMRLTGFCVPHGADGLVIQSLTVDPADLDVQITFHTVGFGEAPGQRTATAIILVPDDDLDGPRPPGPVEVRLPTGQTLHLDTAAIGDETAAEAITRQLGATRRTRDAVFLNPEQLTGHLDLPRPLRLLVELDEWQHPGSGEPPATSPDLQLVIEALRRRRQINRPVTTATWPQYLAER